MAVPNAGAQASAELAQLEEREGIEREALWETCQGGASPASALFDDLEAGIRWEMEIADMRRPRRLIEMLWGGEDRLLRPATRAGGDAYVEDFCGSSGGQGDGG